MDADYRQYSKPQGSGCCVAVIGFSAFSLSIICAGMVAHLTGLDPLPPDEMPRAWAVAATEVVVIALVLVLAIVRLRRKRRLPQS